MNKETAGRTRVTSLVLLIIALAALVLAAVALTVALLGGPSTVFPGGMMGGNRGGMVGGSPSGVPSGANPAGGLQPGDTGFVAGTVAAPRIVRVYAGPGYAFSPTSIAVARGETVTFAVTTMGPLIHEFMVGPADAVAADAEGTAEVADIGMMQTKSLTYTLEGDGPFAFACHVAGHYEAGMRGTITLGG